MNLPLPAALALHKLPKDYVECIVSAFLNSPPAWNNPTFFVVNYIQLLTGQMPWYPSISPVPNKVSIDIVLVSLFDNTGLPLYAFFKATQILSVVCPGVQFVVAHAYTFEKDHISVSICDSVRAMLPFQVTHMGDLKDWPALAATLPSRHPGILVHSLLGPSCNDSARCQPNAQRKDLGIHGPVSNIVWKAYEGIYHLYNASLAPNPQPLVGWTHEYVVPEAYLDNLELNELFGLPIPVCGAEVGCASRPRRIRGNPFTPAPNPVAFINKFDPCYSPDGQRWTPKQAGAFPMSLRAHFPRLVAMHSDDLTAFERRTLANLMVTGVDGVPCLPSLTTITNWLGYSEELRKSIADTFPCLGVINVHTGRVATCTDSPDVHSKCGAAMYCYNCACLIERIGRGWNLLNFVNYLVYQLRTYVHVISTGNRNFMYAPYRKPHNCTMHCRKF